MIVVGGVYGEHCVRPDRRTVMGSGMRAAACLAARHRKVALHCAIDRNTARAAEHVAGGLNVELRAVPRSEPVSFEYYTPLSGPTINGREAKFVSAISATGRSALVFGMIEGHPIVDAERVVFDPQQPRDLSALDLSGITTRRLAVCANARETRQLGKAKDLRAAAKSTLRRYSADVVVTKCGAVGALVTTARGQSEVGPRPTPSVMPIGTGDAFAAGFAFAWAHRRLPPARAARVASAAAAAWADGEVLPLDLLGIVAGKRQWRAIPMRQPQVYIAGPYFSIGQMWLVDLVRESIIGLGAKAFSPFHDVGPGGDEVAKADLQGLRKSDSVLALVDGVDGGTVFEAGWAMRAGVPVVAYSADRNAEWQKMLRGAGAEVHSDLSTAVYRAIWRGMDSMGSSTG